MKKASLPMIAAIQTRLTAATAKDKEGLAKIAIENAEKAFVKDCETELKLLKSRKAILEQQKAEHVYIPAKSEIMALEHNIERQKVEFDRCVENAEETLVTNLVQQALNGSISKDVFRQLYRLKKRDITLAPLQSAARNLKYAETQLEKIVKDSQIEDWDNEIAEIDAEIAVLKDMMS